MTLKNRSSSANESLSGYDLETRPTTSRYALLRPVFLFLFQTSAAVYSIDNQQFYYYEMPRSCQ